MSIDLDVDYLVVSAGLAGMAITDELLTHSAATVAIVVRRHAPGGHWIDAYPFVPVLRLLRREFSAARAGQRRQVRFQRGSTSWPALTNCAPISRR